MSALVETIDTVVFEQPKPENRLSRSEETRALIRSIAEKHGVTFADVIGPNRSRIYLRPRCEAMRAVRELRPQMSYPQMARIFRRDHSTCLHHINKHCACDRRNVAEGEP